MQLFVCPFFTTSAIKSSNQSVRVCAMRLANTQRIFLSKYSSPCSLTHWCKQKRQTNACERKKKFARSLFEHDLLGVRNCESAL